jgi:hypothetical protein
VPPKPKRPKPAPKWTDADLDKLTEIAPADQEAAKKLWRERAPQAFRDLLDAETDAVSLG